MKRMTIIKVKFTQYNATSTPTKLSGIYTPSSNLYIQNFLLFEDTVISQHESISRIIFSNVNELEISPHITTLKSIFDYMCNNNVDIGCISDTK